MLTSLVNKVVRLVFSSTRVSKLVTLALLKLFLTKSASKLPNEFSIKLALNWVSLMSKFLYAEGLLFDAVLADTPLTKLVAKA